MKKIELEIRSMSRASSGRVAQMLIAEGISFEYQHSGGVVSGYFVITDPSDEQMIFIKRHFKAQMRKREAGQQGLIEGGN